MSSKHLLRIDWATYKAAKYACVNWHYSKSMPVGKTVKIGVWEYGKYIGVVIFAYGANNNISKPYNLLQTECCELVRVALDYHLSAVSRIVAIALRFLMESNPGLRLVVSYADTNQGHYGCIYQAGGWYFIGKSKGAVQYIVGNRVVHSMQVQTFIRSGKLKTRAGLEKVAAGDKYKYVMPLDIAMKEQIEPLSKPYPKREKQAMQGDHPSSGGATPTLTLQ